MRNVALIREALIGLFLAAASIMPKDGAAQAAQPPRQGDPPQSRSVFELSQQAERDATRAPLRMPQAGVAETRADRRPIVKLRSVTVKGARSVEADMLAAAYRPYIGKTVSQADLVQ